MFNSRFLIFIVAAATMLVGCASSPEILYTPPALEEEWSVKMTLSGGFAGVMQSIEVDANGNYTVKDERSASVNQGKLPAEELSKLEELVAALEITAPQSRSTCADCFLYAIEVQSNGKKMIVNADDMTLEETGIEPLAQFLRELMDLALK